jgi:predicted alpha/beta-hydrolase family hydrolase
MQAWAERLSSLGRVVAFDYAYRRQGRSMPDRLPVLIAAHRDELHRARADHDGPVFLAGKSMGGRIGCHLALEERVDGLVCFGYPLKGVGKNGRIRDEVLLKLTTPVLFLQGTRDPLCPLGLLSSVRPRMQAPSTLHVVESGDHSLVLRKRDLARLGKTQGQVDDEILAAVSSFIDALH